MRIVFIHPDLGIGGAERLVVDAALALRSKGHKVRFVTNQFSANHCFQEVLDFDIQVIQYFPRSIFGKFNALCAYIRMCIAAIVICWMGNVDLIFCDQVSACVPIFKWFSGAKVLFYCHFPDQLLTKRDWFLKQFYRYFLDFYEAWSTSKADIICVNSQFTEGIVRDTLKPVSNADLHVLYPTLNTKFFDKAPVVDIDFVPLNVEHVFLSINRYEVKKNIELALEAFAKLHDELDEEEFKKCFLIIAGGYDKLNDENIAYYSKLKKIAEDLEIPKEQIAFVKSPSDVTKINLLRRASMVIYTPRNEHFGIVPIEAMYMEKCVLACDSGGPTESIVNGRTGFLCPPDAYSFSRILLKAVKSPEEIAELGRNGKLRMPTISVKKALLDEFLGKSYSEQELDELCFDYGLEVDDIVKEKNDAGVEEDVFKIEIPANRYDLLCVEGLTRALKVFKKELKTPKYSFVKPDQQELIIVKPETKSVRGVLVAAVLRNVSLNKDSYASFIDLQDKLHQNICRRRTLVSMGTHDLDTIKGPFEYRAEPPKKIKFKPLNQTKEMDGAELMEFYQNDLHLREYLHIIRDKPLYPVIYDANGVVCSLPPIINGDHSKITLNTKNILIEVTATDLKKAKIVLDTVVAMFSQYCADKFTVEPVQVKYSDDEIIPYPELAYRQISVEMKNINTKIGLNLNANEMIDLLEKMSLECKVDPKDDSKLLVTIPPTRHDILHECDIAEDVGLAYGYNNIVLRVPEAHTVAQQFPLNKLTEQMRSGVVAAGWTEVLNFALCSTDDVSTKMRKPNQLDNVVKISNPKTMEFQVARNALIPGLLKTLSYNKDMPLPLKIFEIQDIIIKDSSADTNSRNERHLAALYYSKSGGFEVIHGFLNRMMELFDYYFKKPEGKGYFIKEHDDPSFFPGRCAQVLINGRTLKDKPVVVGIFGILHPEVISGFALTMPCSALELNLEAFL